MSLDYGRLLGLPIAEHATCDVDELRHFTARDRKELGAARVHCERALDDLAGLQEHMAQHLANVQMPKMREPLAPKGRMHSWLMCGISLRCCKCIVLLKP